MLFLTSCFLLSLVCNASMFDANGNTDKDLENLDGPVVDVSGNDMTETHDSKAECVETCKEEWCWVELTKEKCQSKCVKRCSNSKKEWEWDDKTQSKAPFIDCVRDCMDKKDVNQENKHVYRKECKDACNSFHQKEPDHSDEHPNDSWDNNGKHPILIGDYSVIDCVRDCTDKKDVNQENRHLYRKECKDVCDSLHYKEPDHSDEHSNDSWDNNGKHPIFIGDYSVIDCVRDCIDKKDVNQENRHVYRKECKDVCDSLHYKEPGHPKDDHKQKEKESKKQQKEAKRSRKYSEKIARKKDKDKRKRNNSGGNLKKKGKKQ